MWLNMILIYSSDTWDHTITMMMERMRWDLEISIMEEVTPEMRVSYRSSIYFFTGTLIFPSILRRIHLLDYCTIFLYTTILDTAFPLHLGSAWPPSIRLVLGKAKPSKRWLKKSNSHPKRPRISPSSASAWSIMAIASSWISYWITDFTVALLNSSAAKVNMKKTWIKRRRVPLLPLKARHNLLNQHLKVDWVLSEGPYH